PATPTTVKKVSPQPTAIQDQPAAFPAPASPRPPSPPESQAPRIGETLIIPEGQSIIVRRGPSERLARIARLPGGTRMQVKFVRHVGKTIWLEVNFGKGKSGWIPARDFPL
ncbi:MAG TPA: hypothetical protein PKO06_04160, partial [Candidatus Ozemobacteraceae bacterium]|nr:hypothetical protein [Candidatus Ozemobacteraceae bacterium]